MLDTLANVKSRLGITGTENDTFLTQQIVLISDVINQYCGRIFEVDDYIQTFYRTDYTPGGILDVYHWPLISVASVVEDGVPLDSGDYRLNKKLGKIIRPEGYFFLPEETVVTFQSGYNPIPPAILDVLDSLVLERYNKKISGVGLSFGSDVQRISIPGAIAIDFDYSLNNNERKAAFGSIIGNNANVLDPYRSDRTIIGDGKLFYVELAP